MSLVNLEQVVTHYTLSSHPRNESIIDLTNKRTGELAFIKIRHKVPDMYAIRLVDPKTFVAYAETHCKSATTRTRKIILHCGDENNKDDKEVALKETSRIGFEWCFEWANEKYRWIRESRMSMSGPLECRRKTGGGDVCVAQYLPRGIKNEYFGLISLPGYNMTGLDDQQRRGLELILCISLLTILDKADGSSWSMMKRNNNVVLETNDNNTGATMNSTANGRNNNKKIDPITELPVTPSTSKKEEQKRIKIDREVQQMLERDIRRSQKQILLEDNYTNNIRKPSSSSASSSKNNSPQTSPIPTPTTSTKTLRTTGLSRQKSASLLRDRLTSSQLANMKHLDATATLQLPAAAAAASNTATPSLATLFSSPPPASTTTTTTTSIGAPTTTKMTNNKKPVSSNGQLITSTKSNNSAANSMTTSPATTPSGYYSPNPLPFYCYAQSSQQTSISPGGAKSGSNSSVVQSHGATSVRWDHHTEQLQQLQQQKPSSNKRPKAQRRVSTGDQILQHHYQYRPMYPQQQHHQIHLQQQHIHHQQQQQQQRYATDYYNYNYLYN